MHVLRAHKLSSRGSLASAFSCRCSRGDTGRHFVSYRWVGLHKTISVFNDSHGRNRKRLPHLLSTGRVLGERCANYRVFSDFAINAGSSSPETNLPTRSCSYQARWPQGRKSGKTAEGTDLPAYPGSLFLVLWAMPAEQAAWSKKGGRGRCRPRPETTPSAKRKRGTQPNCLACASRLV